jgi:hypothetical protein
MGGTLRFKTQSILCSSVVCQDVNLHSSAWLNINVGPEVLHFDVPPQSRTDPSTKMVLVRIPKGYVCYLQDCSQLDQAFTAVVVRNSATWQSQAGAKAVRRRPEA